MKCYACDAPINLETLTPRVDLIERYTCPNCGARTTKAFTVEEWIVKIWERLDGLEVKK